ncbi:formin 2 domain-containing protein [Theileria equi strain WA]|uniref:Formin 2 domain-containing protein n=1 Tax=Theileria equi strain WA TaxID=1537102 RepID=L0B0G9_THEEQ|nr:formin 2 domain-containing protein [Theileria equi strain WA]AFZ81347.1 formin 2 domain-containing protein [Theileria equi strain WA]|eukprot:XP_004831013.1 formin 2 domain-containing protein [Theileria equi strain WA]
MEYIDHEDGLETNFSNMDKINITSAIKDLSMNRDCNISPCALGLSIRMDLEKRRNTQTPSERQAMLSGSFTDVKCSSNLPDKINEAINIIKKLERSSGSLLFREALATRMQLRTMSLKNFSTQNYGDALIQSHYSLLLAKKFHMEIKRVPLSGEMAMELLILSKCYAQFGKYDRGKEHLDELRFLVENTLLYYDDSKKDEQGDHHTIINCDKKIFPDILYTFAEVLSCYGMWKDAELFFSKYLVLISKIYGQEDMKLSNAINNVCIYMLRSKQYLKALPLAIKALEIQKKNLGDYDAEVPNIKVANAYCNVGIIYRLLNNPVDALHQLFIAIDMKMRIYKDRKHSSIQDILLSIGSCLHSLNNYSAAASIYREVYTRRCEKLGKQHQSTLSVKQLLEDLDSDIVVKELKQKEEEKVEIRKSYEKQIDTPNPNIEIARIQALYCNKNNHYNVPIRRVESTSNYIIPKEELVELSKKIFIQYSNKRLPIINIPRLYRGKLFLNEGQPLMECNQDAVDLFTEWGLVPPEVTAGGDVISKGSSLPENVLLFIPLTENDNVILKGFYDKPIFVPNPAIYHSTFLDKLKESSKINLSNTDDKGISSDRNMEKDLGTNQVTESDGIKTKEPHLRSSLSVKERVQEMERKNTVKPEIKPKGTKIEPEPVEITLYEMIKNKDDSKGSNAKFLAKIGSLANLKVKQNIIPEIKPTTLRKSAAAQRISRALSKKGIVKIVSSQPKVMRSPLSSSSDLNSDTTLSDIEENNCNNKCIRDFIIPIPTVSATLVDKPRDLPLNLKSLDDKIPDDFVQKVRLLKLVKKEDGIESCLLMDDTGSPIAYVPWQIDIISLTLAKSCIENDFSRKYGIKEVKSVSEGELEGCRNLLMGQGLTELGFGKLLGSVDSIGNSLTSGISLNIPSSVLKNIKEQSEILEKEKQAKEVSVKKAPPKIAPISKKKAPPAIKGKGMKGPPPPPSPSPLLKAKQKTKSTVADNSKTRRFFWDPIYGDDVKGTIFTKQKITPSIKKQELEESFAKSVPKEKEQVSTKPKMIQLLPDSKRSYNMNIGLSKFSKYTFKELREAIIDLDPAILTVDATESLLLLIPTPEECSIVSEFVKSGGDLTMVDRPEQFVAVLLGIPILKQRLEAHHIALLFKDNYNEISVPLESIMEGCEAIMSSDKLNVLSHFILNIGNTLNEGDPKKGNAEGFKPTTFAKLNDFRTTTKPPKTLLQYICDMAADEDESILEIIDELKSCEDCTKIDIAVVEEQMNRFKTDITKIKNAISVSEKSKDFKDQFSSIMNEFLRDAEPKILVISEQYKEVVMTFKDTAKYLGYTEKEIDKVKPNELFGHVWGFVQSVDKCKKIRIENRIKEEMKLAAKNKKAEGNIKISKKITPSNSTTAIPKIMDNGMKNIVKTLG